MTNATLSTTQPKVYWCSCSVQGFQESTLYQSLEPNTWVRLLESLSAYSYDEALLLCQHSESEWFAWIPDHGEAILNTNQFCLPHESQ